MSIEKFISRLNIEVEGPFLEGDRVREVHYINEHLWSFQHTVSLIPDSESELKILDIGPTPFTLYLKDRWPKNDVYALDRTMFFAERFSRSEVSFRSCDLDTDCIPFASSFFDVVIFTEVMEHIFRSPIEVLMG